MCWVHMGIAQPSVNRANVEKVVQTILACLYSPPLPGNAHMETTHFKKGLPLAIENAMWNVELKDG